jgi:nanoRNase/pAp phosphatase (c-di-AMP/oligoRNAs hydrolase)
MVIQDFFSSLREPLTTAQTIFILLPQNPNLDKVAASLALFLSLQKAGKQTTIACLTEMTVEFSALVGVDKIQTKLGGRNLVISFDYLEDSIEKVSYNIENNKFNLVVQPKTGFPSLSTEKVDYSYSGGEADLVFTVGAKNLESLGGLSQSVKSSEKQIMVDLDVNPANTQFGRINLVNPQASSCSEMVVWLISRLNLPIDEDMASNLFLGIERMTSNFSSPRVSAATFEAAAFCLRAGARRTRRPDFRQKRQRVKQKKKVSLQPMPTEVSAVKKPEEPGKKKPSLDWFEPKIYKGNTRI